MDRKAALYLVGAPAHARVPQGDLAEDEPARGKRGRRGNDEQFESELEHEFRRSVHGLKPAPIGHHRFGG